MVWCKCGPALRVGGFAFAMFASLAGCTDEALRAPIADADDARATNAANASGDASPVAPVATGPSYASESRSSANNASEVSALEGGAPPTDPTRASLLETNAPCSAGAECQSGVCEGQGCEGELGRCMPESRPCFRDLVPFCGCDGETFRASSNCPRQRYRARGVCQAER